MTSAAVLPLLVCVLGCLAVSLLAASVPDLNREEEREWTALLRSEHAFPLTQHEQWATFKNRYRKIYTKQEEEKRQRVFFARLSDIELHNYKASIGQESYTRGVNEWSDMEYSELFATKGNCDLGENANITLLASKKFKLPDPDNLPTLPKTVDWTTKGYVTPVKNQMDCGSCWAFAATGVLEGQMARTTGKLVSLSEQNLVDCASTWGNNGCGGGLALFALQYVADNGGIDSEESYPYKDRAETCKYREAFSVAQDTGFTLVATGGNEALLKWAVATFGPIAVSINVQRSMFDYTGGVYNDTSCKGATTHAVLVVGYGTYPMTGQDYWLVKNSWGSFWGAEGYIRMLRNAGNQCEIATRAVLPVM